jgi:polysaccharide export outer membrane protein
MKAMRVALASALMMGGNYAYADVSATTGTQSTPTARPIDPSTYAIGPQDTLIVDVFDVPELSRTVQVDDSGKIILPLIGAVTANGRTPEQLSSDIAAVLRKRYMKDPVVTVSVKDATSQKITVDGSVTQPGVYQIGPGTTLVEAVALARGPDQVADLHHVAIVREEAGKKAISVFDLADIRDGKAVDPTVKPNDIIVVDASGTRRFVRDFGSFLATLSLMRP